MKLFTLTSAFVLSSLFIAQPSQGLGINTAIKNTTGYDVKEKAKNLKESAKKKREKVVAKAKEKGAYLVTNYGIETIVTKVSGKEVETTDSLLLRLDNMVSAEVIIKMIKLMQADMKFQLDRRQVAFDQNKAMLEKILDNIETKMKDLKQKVTQKINDNIAVYQAKIKGKQEVVDQAKQTLDADNTTLITVINSIDAITGSEVIGGIRGLVVDMVSAKKGAAQSDINRMNNDIAKIQTNLQKEQDKLAKAINNPKFVAQMQSANNLYQVVVEAMGNLQANYEAFRETDFFNYFDDKQVKYDTEIKEFTQQAGCEVNLTKYDPGSLDAAISKLQNCKKNVINGIAGKSVPYLMQDTKFQSTPACNTLEETSDIADVEQCLSNFEGIPLTSFGSASVKQ